MIVSQMTKQKDLTKPLSLQGIENFLQKGSLPELCQEMTVDSIGAEFVYQKKKGEEILREDLIIWYYTETKGNMLIDKISKKFTEADILEHYGFLWKQVMPRDQHSIGYLFGEKESLQKEFNVAEYQVSQTTLEQIFNTFAMMSESKPVNRQNTIARRSTRKSGYDSQIMRSIHKSLHERNSYVNDIAKEYGDKETGAAKKERFLSLDKIVEDNQAEYGDEN